MEIIVIIGAIGAFIDGYRRKRGPKPPKSEPGCC